MFEKQILAPILNAFKSFSGGHAFFINERHYSYENLAALVSGIRSEIQRTSIDSRTIGLVTNDDIETYASIIAIWLEGYAYVPLHPHHPVERGEEIIQQAEIDLLMDSSPTPVFPAMRILNSKDLPFDGLNLEPLILPDTDLAYILFTSGSTGKPKGVPITRGNLGAFMKAFWETGIQVDEKDRCLQAFDLTFDVSVQAFLVPLVKGACVYTIPHDQIKYSYASELLEDQRLTFCVMAPSMVRFFKPYFEEIDLPDIRYNILTAEASALDLVEEWSACVPNAEIFDFYGPTEATIYCTYSRFYREAVNKELNGMLSIGKPLFGVTAIITDEKGDIQPTNQKGELCISGDQVTPGYWKNPDKNAESFFEKEVDGLTKRFYKTGDLCFFDPDGDIMYAGRLDFQVKIQGYRIELGEIEHHAREIIHGENVVALSYENRVGSHEIAMFVEGGRSDFEDLKKQLKLRLPSYMIPSKIMGIDHFPLNSSDKVDRKALKKQISI
ncbi:MAG: amino acid adenylation domain-containing protein [Bacteroidales bacterium]|nr:amino acid adenylation domain-containing protein [Bacteroidales bacterium]